jgi:hypothetical protein
MPHLTFPLHTDGMVVQAEIGLIESDAAALVQAGRPIPRPVKVRALVDTGADRTSVATHVIQHLALAPFIYGILQTAGGSLKVNLYRVALSVSSLTSSAAPTLSLPDLLVSELTVSLPFDVLIGLDVLRECLLVLDGSGQQFILSF